MNTHEVAAEYRLSQWAKIVQAKQESGQSVKDFCEAQGIRKNIYFYWQRKVREAACLELARQKNTSDPAPPGWLQLAPSQEETKTTLTIEINGCRITVTPATDPALLKEVCRHLRTL